MRHRFSKKIYTKSGATWSLSNEKKFVYDGYKQIAEYAGTTATMLTVWQPESSGDFDVPLWSKTGTEVQTYIVDGNKNVRQLKNAAGTVIANYDYDPFGNVTATGSVTPWQFSSEYRDAENNLIYYNYRYYAPTIGRWLTRDPIEEQMMALYTFVLNQPIFYWDHLGNNMGIIGTDPSNPLDVIPTWGFPANTGPKWIFPPNDAAREFLFSLWGVSEWQLNPRLSFGDCLGRCIEDNTFDTIYPLIGGYVTAGFPKIIQKMLGFRVIMQEDSSIFAWKLDKMILGNANLVKYKSTINKAIRGPSVAFLLIEGGWDIGVISECLCRCYSKFYELDKMFFNIRNPIYIFIYSVWE